MSFITSAAPALGQIWAPLQIRTVGRDVVASGSVLTADPTNLEFQIAQLRVVLKFANDSGTTRMETESASSESLNLKLYNFNNSIGSGTTLPVEIGTLGGRRLFLAFMIYALSPESSKTVHYTFMLGDSK